MGSVPWRFVDGLTQTGDNTFEEEIKEKMMLKVTFRVWAATMLLSVAGWADHGNGNGNRNAAFSSGIIGSVPNQSIAGVTSGGAPWVVREGHARLRSNGKLNVEVEGLLITAGVLATGNPVPQNLIGTTGPVTMVAASLVCNGVVVGSTAVAPLSTSGNAEMEGKVTTAACGSPTVLVRIAPSTSATAAELGAFIAVSGTGPGTGDDEDDDDRGNDRNQHDKGDDHGPR